MRITREQVEEIFSDNFGMTNLPGTLRLNEDLGFDSLDRVTLLVDIETAVGQELPEALASTVETVDDVYKLLDNQGLLVKE